MGYVYSSTAAAAVCHNPFNRPPQATGTAAEGVPRAFTNHHTPQARRQKACPAPLPKWIANELRGLLKKQRPVYM